MRSLTSPATHAPISPGVSHEVARYSGPYRMGSLTISINACADVGRDLRRDRSIPGPISKEVSPEVVRYLRPHRKGFVTIVRDVSDHVRRGRSRAQRRLRPCLTRYRMRLIDASAHAEGDLSRGRSVSVLRLMEVSREVARHLPSHPRTERSAEQRSAQRQ